MADNRVQDDASAAADLSFETVYGRLEEAVQRLEDGGLSLAQSIEVFEEGMRLAKACRELLDGAELRITTLAEEYRLLETGSPRREEL